MYIFSHLAVTIAFYLILENNPKIKKYVDGLFTLIAVLGELAFSAGKRGLKKIFKK